MLRPLQKKKNLLRVCQLRCQGVPPGGVAQIGLSRLSSSEPTICLASTHRVREKLLQMLQASLLGRMENPELQNSPMRWVEYAVGVSSQTEMTCSRNLITCVSVCPTTLWNCWCFGMCMLCGKPVQCAWSSRTSHQAKNIQLRWSKVVITSHKARLNF